MLLHLDLLDSLFKLLSEEVNRRAFSNAAGPHFLKYVISFVVCHHTLLLRTS